MRLIISLLLLLTLSGVACSLAYSYTVGPMFGLPESFAPVPSQPLMVPLWDYADHSSMVHTLEPGYMVEMGPETLPEANQRQAARQKA